jgi:hypothetical protein
MRSQKRYTVKRYTGDREEDYSSSSSKSEDFVAKESSHSHLDAHPDEPKTLVSIPSTRLSRSSGSDAEIESEHATAHVSTHARKHKRARLSALKFEAAFAFEFAICVNVQQRRARAFAKGIAIQLTAFKRQRK